MQVEQRDGGERERPERAPRGSLGLPQRERERPERQRHGREVVEEPDQERLAPEERAAEERKAGVGAEGPQKRTQRVGKSDGDEGEQDQVRPLRGPEGKRERRARQVVEQVLRLAEGEREVLTGLPGGVPPVPQGCHRRNVLGEIGEGQVVRGPERNDRRRGAGAQEPGPERVVFVGPVQGR